MRFSSGADTNGSGYSVRAGKIGICFYEETEFIGL